MSQELKAHIGLDTTELQQGLKRAETEITGFLNRIDNIAAIGQKLQNIGQSLTVGLTLPIVALGGASIKAYGDIQSLQKGLEAVMGSASSAGDEFNRLKEVAKLPGLGMQEAVRGSINLQAIGIDADRSRKILQEFGNAVATVGKGRAEFERAIYGVQQLANTDFPLGEDLNIIKDALPQVSNLLKEAFGSSRSDELAAMGVSSKQVLDVILQGLGELPRVTGGINGAFENLGDAMRTNLGRIGKVIDDAFDIGAIIDKVTSFVDRVVSAFESLNPAIQKSILVFGGLVAAAGPLITALGLVMAALPSIVSGFGLVQVALTKVGGVMGLLTNPIALVTAGLIGIVTAVVANWGKIRPYVEGTINWFRKLYNESTLVRGGVETIYVAFSVAFKGISGILKTGWEVIKSFVRLTADAFAGLGDVILGALSLNPDTIAQGLAGISIAVNRGMSDIWTDLRLGFYRTAAEFNRIGMESVNRFKNGISKDPIKLDFELSTKTNSDDDGGGGGKGIEKIASKVKELKTELNGLEAFRAFRDMEDSISSLSGKVVKFPSIADVIQGENDKLAYAVQNFIKNTEDERAAFESWIKSIQDTESQILESGILDFGASIGEALVNGTSAIRAGASAILSTLSAFTMEFAKRVAQMAVTAGVLGQLLVAIKKSVTNPIALIAIAATAAVVAGALAAQAKKVASTGTGGGNYGGGGTFTPDTGVRSYSSSYGANSMGSGEVVFRISGTDLVGVLQRNQYKLDRLS